MQWTPHSALAIFVKDLVSAFSVTISPQTNYRQGIVLDEAKRLLYPATLSAAAHQLYLMGSSHGWDKEADGGVVRVWELMTGISVAGKANVATEAPAGVFEPRQYPKLPVKDTLAKLPPAVESDVLPLINERISKPSTPILVILDDDPTGTQTCHDINVLTVWDHETLKAEFAVTTKGFFILTNSRALPPVEAKELINTICRNVDIASKAAQKEYSIVLRGDSTLRGHFPDEPDAVEEVIGKADNWILAPFFFQGGRYTIEDVHYVAEGGTLVPASQTPFAADATFGYKSSNLRDYVLEKTGSRFTKDNLYSITLDDIRKGGPKGVTEKLLAAPKGSVIIVNAAAESDMFVFAAGVLEAEQTGKKYLYRTGAAFVSSRLGIRGIPPLSAHDLDMDYASKKVGGLIVAGSYVPKTTAQLASLRERRGNKLHVIELDVEMMIKSEADAAEAVKSAITEASTHIIAGKDVLVMTSRKLITGADAISSLNIGSVIAKALVAVVQGIEVRPRYVIAKGGITSSDAATKGLNMRKALIVGQAAPGVPLWRCDEEASRHRGVPYVVFPGNVGSDTTLAEVVEKWAL